MRGPFRFASSWLLIWVLSSALVSADFVIKDGQLSVLDSAGISAETVEVSATTAHSDKILSLTPQNTLKLSFHILGSSPSEQDSKGLIPHQVHLLATGLETKLHWNAVLKDLARAPTDFLSLGKKIRLEILIADSPSSHKPLRQKLATLDLAPNMVLPYPYWDTKDGSPPSNLELEKYGPQPPLEWTFQAPRKPINPVFSLVFTGIVLSPWLILLSAWSTLSSCSTPEFKILSSPTSSTVIFLATIASQELLILTYWACLRLYQYIPIALFLALPLILSGRTALRELRARRKKGPISGSHLIMSKIFGTGSKGKAKRT